ISPAIYLIAAAIAVLIIGVFAAANPKGRLEHFLAAHYLAPALMVPALALGCGVIYLSSICATIAQNAVVDGVVIQVSSVGLFITKGGYAQLTVDPFAAIMSLVAIAGTLIVMLMSIDCFGEFQKHKAEYYALLMFATAAASLAAAASDLIAILLTIEFISLVSYVLAAYSKHDRRSGEAGLKYFLYGAACSAIMLYGMSILFGVSGGNTSLEGIARGFYTGSSGVLPFGAAQTGAGWVGVMFVLVGLGFKLALVPFQFWAPDVYEGSPTPVTAFLSVVSKTAGLAVLVRFMMVVANPATSPLSLSWYWILALMCALSMFWGNLVAIPQRNIKRMMAYSSIAQVGYMMIGVLAAMHIFTRANTQEAVVRAGVAGIDGLPWGMQGVLIFLVAYLLMNLGAFAVVSAVGRRIGSDYIDDYAGLARRSPFYAAALAVFFASLAGIPPTAGFLGKLFVFGSAIKIGIMGHPELIGLAIAGVVNSVISVYYYFNVVRVMYFVPGKAEGRIQGSTAANTAVAVTLALTIAFLLFAKPISGLASRAVYTSYPVAIGSGR
ncbi:MAG: NADH-quinone oxidoreductase subunit N, partial [Armatimonadetes bacterium]|nr:NADH-quinone oxidoreductase subunit N [Armatimonadota bacterium]